MSELSKKIVNLEQNLLELKTNQRTQNDSFQFYAYQSDNFYARSWNTITAEFIPDGKVNDDIVCEFTASIGSAVQFIEIMVVDKLNPCKAVYQVASSQVPGLPTWMQFAYILCMSNCKGELKLTFN